MYFKFDHFSGQLKKMDGTESGTEKQIDTSTQELSKTFILHLLLAWRRCINHPPMVYLGGKREPQKGGTRTELDE